jgi:uncharacterized protein YjiK
MRRLAAGAAIVSVVAAALGCRPSKGESSVSRDTAALAARESRFSETMRQTGDSGSSRDVPIARWVLPKTLSEISGIAATPDGRLLGHNDEAGMVYEIDYRRGMVVKQFRLGKQIIREDFEAITVAGDRIFLLASHGDIYEFREGKDGDRVDFVVHDTRLGRECEFEGVAYDSAASSLVLACKNVGIKDLKDFVLLYRWKLDSGSETSQIKVPMADAVGSNGWKNFTPSDMVVDPLTGNYILLASQEQGLLAITPQGQVIFSRPLPKGHPMAEGIAITRDSLLIISDEMARGPATVTIYRWP